MRNEIRIRTHQGEVKIVLFKVRYGRSSLVGGCMSLTHLGNANYSNTKGPLVTLLKLTDLKQVALWQGA